MSLDPQVWGGILDLPHPNRPAGKGQIVGFRLSSVQEDAEEFDQAHVALGSLGAGNSRWLPGVNQATCRAGHGRRHRAPVRECTCGFYAGSDLVALSRVVGGLGTHEGVVLCGVQAWGRLVVHDWGFRAQFARIVTITDQLPSRVIRTIDGRVIRLLTRPSIDCATAGYLTTYYRAHLVPLSEIAAATAQFGDFLTVRH